MPSRIRTDARSSSRSSFRQNGSAATRLRQRTRMCSGGCVRGWVSQEAKTNRQRVCLQAAEQLSLHWRGRAQGGEVLQLERRPICGSPAGYSIQRVPPAPDRFGWEAVIRSSRLNDASAPSDFQIPADNLSSIVVMLWAVRLLIIVALTTLGSNNSRMLHFARISMISSRTYKTISVYGSKTDKEDRPTSVPSC